MARADETFVESLLLAQAEALSEREERLMHARYGLTSGTPRTLEAIAQEWLLTRERVRQLLQRAQRKLRLKGKRDIDRGSTETACASLLLSLGYGSNGEGNEQKEKLIALAQSALAYLPQENYAIPLLVSLCIPEKEAKTFLRDLLQSVKQQAEREKKEQAERKRLEKSPRAFAEILAHIRWPRETSSGLERFAHLAEEKPSPEPEQEEAIRGQHFLSDKLQRTVHYRSLVEMRFFQALELSEAVTFYQERPFKVTEEVQGKLLTCTPDVFFLLRDGRGVLAEVTSRDFMALQSSWRKYNALRLLCLKQGWGLLITDGVRTLQQLKQHPVALSFQTALLEALDRAENGSLSWEEYRAVREHYHGTHQDFLAIVLNQRLIWSLEPFTLRRA